MSDELVTFEKLPNGNLKLTLTEAGWQECQEADELVGQLPSLNDLIEYQLGNGWDEIAPEEIGALTSAPILSDTARYNDAGDLTGVGTVYWFPAYEVFDPVERMYRKGEVIFQGVESEQAS